MRKIITSILLTLCMEVGLMSTFNVKFSEKISFEGFGEENTLNVNLELNDAILDECETARIDVVYESAFVYDIGDYNKITAENVDELKTKRIEAGKEYHSSLNEKNYENFPSYDFHDIYLSSYFPIISVVVDVNQLIDDKYEILNKIAEIENVLDVVVKPNSKDKIVANQGLAYGEINVLNEVRSGSLTGNGVKIGLLDTGIVDTDYPNFENTEIITRDRLLFFEIEAQHPTCMAALFGGEHGIAPAASIYSVEAFNNLSSELDWLIEQNVDVVNMSLSSERTGDYESQSALVDYMIWSYGISVCAADGNENTNDGERLCGDLGMAYNAITVGMSGVDGVISGCHGYNTVNGVDKPTICSYGNGLTVQGVWVDMSGTSVSTALTTGVVALLMELDPTLKLYPAKVTAVLTAGSYYLNDEFFYFEDSGLDEYAGSGIVDFEKARDCINNIIHYQFNGVAESLDILCTNNVSLTSDLLLRMSICWLAKSTGSKRSLRNNNFDIAVHKVTAGEVACTQGTTGTLDMINYITEYGGTYKVRMLISGDVTNYGNQDVFICWSLRPLDE